MRGCEVKVNKVDERKWKGVGSCGRKFVCMIKKNVKKYEDEWRIKDE